MDKLTLGTKASNGIAFAAGTIAQVAIFAFASKTALIYGYSAINRAKHILATNGKVWNPSQFNSFGK